MITNERAYRIAQVQAGRLREALAAAKSREPSPRRTIAVHALEKELRDLETGLKAYDQLKAAAGKTKLEGRIEDLGTLIASARIARGWTQAQLAERLGLHMQQIQDYEARGYDRTSVERVRDVLKALGADVQLTIKMIPFPAGIAEAITEASTRKPRTREKTSTRS